MNKKSVLDTLDEHYFRHPVKIFEKRNVPAANLDETVGELDHRVVEIGV